PQPGSVSLESGAAKGHAGSEAARPASRGAWRLPKRQRPTTPRPKASDPRPRDGGGREKGLRGQRPAGPRRLPASRVAREGGEVRSWLSPSGATRSFLARGRRQDKLQIADSERAALEGV